MPKIPRALSPAEDKAKEVKVVSVRFDPQDHELLREVDAAAKEADRPRSNIIIKLIRLGLDAWKKAPAYRDLQ